MIFKHLSFAQGSDTAEFFDKNLNEIENINKVAPYEYASLEIDSYDIDKPRKLYTDEPLGYNSGTLSNDLGLFSSPLLISVQFAENIDFFGLTFEADALIAGRIELYFGSNIVRTIYITIDNYNSINVQPIEVTHINLYIDRIDKPNRFLNVFGIKFGKTFDLTSKIKSVKMINNVSVSGRELPIDTLQLKITDASDDLIIDSEQKLEIYDDYGNLKYAFYVNEFEKHEDVIDINYTDAVGLLEDEFIGDYYVNKPVQKIVDDIFKNTGLKYDAYEYGGKTVTGYIPVTTKRNALIYLANATGLRIDKHPTIRLMKPVYLSYGNFGDENIFLNSYSYTETKPAKSVRLAVYPKQTIRYDEYEVVFEQQCTAGTYDVLFDEPVYIESVNLSESLKAYEDEESETEVVITGELTSANSMTFTVYTDCYVKIQFKEFWNLDNYTEISKEIENANLYKNRPTEIIDTFTLMGSSTNTDAQTRLNELFDYYTIDKKIKAKVVWNNPYLNGTIKIYNDRCRITKMSSSFDGVAELEAEKIVE